MSVLACSLIVPTLNAEAEIGGLLEALLAQSRVPDEMVVVDSSSDDGTAGVVAALAAEHPNIALHVIPRADFDHGLTRDRALREWTTGELVLFMTQDALPADERYVEALLEPFSDPRVAAASGRQLPKPDARRFEELVRGFNYPEEPSVRSAADLPRYGVKTFFASDVCSAYRRDGYLECGGFCQTMMNEDMYMAAKLVGAGHSVAYAADACVCHSHNLTPKEQYRRNYAIGRFLEEHKELLMGASEVGEGGRLVRSVGLQLLREGRQGELLAFGVDCAARLLGNRMGRREARRKSKEIRR